MDWAIIIGILITAIGSFATAIQAWVAWKQNRLEEAERLKQFPQPSEPAPTLATPTFPTTYSPQSIPISPAGVVLGSEVGADYNKLRDLLVARKFKEADQETTRLMLWIACREKKVG